MNRRIGRRGARGGSGGPSLDARILALSPWSWTGASTYTVDGVSGKVASFPDKVQAGTGIRAVDASHALVQATSANQVAVPSVDATLNNRLSAVFDGNQIYSSSAAASAWRLMQDGTGSEWFLVLNRTDLSGTKYLISTGNGGADTSMFVRHSTTTPNMVQTDGAIQTFSISGAAASTGAHYYDVSFDYAASPKCIWRDRTSQSNTSSVANPPGTGDPFSTLALGGLSGSPSMYANFASLIVFARVLSSDHRAIVQAYISAKYGVT